MNVRKGEPQAVLALANGSTIREAAAQAGIDEKTVRRRLQQPDYVGEIRRLQGETKTAAMARLQSAFEPGVATLIDLLNADSESVRLRSAIAILDRAMPSDQPAFSDKDDMARAEMLRDAVARGQRIVAAFEAGATRLQILPDGEVRDVG